MINADGLNDMVYASKNPRDAKKFRNWLAQEIAMSNSAPPTMEVAESTGKFVTGDVIDCTGQDTEIAVLDQHELFGKSFTIYGDIDDPLFLAKEVAEWIGIKNVTDMVSNIDDDEKLTSIISNSGQKRKMLFLTEDGLYEVLMQSRKPVAKVIHTTNV